jgi:His-Xaa-Ser system protein HxsD
MSEHELVFERDAYSADAIQRAVYRMSGRLSIDLVDEGNRYRCVVHLASADDDPAAALHALRTHILDEVLRERIRTETEGVRNLILSLAFSDTGLTAQD